MGEKGKMSLRLDLKLMAWLDEQALANGSDRSDEVRKCILTRQLMLMPEDTRAKVVKRTQGMQGRLDGL